MTWVFIYNFLPPPVILPITGVNPFCFSLPPTHSPFYRHPFPIFSDGKNHSFCFWASSITILEDSQGLLGIGMTERSRNSITRTHFTKKTKMCILQRLKEASLSKGNSVRRGKMREDFTWTICARNLNKYGRYISIINLKGKRRSVLIIPDLTLNLGWTFVAERWIGSLNPKTNELPKWSIGWLTK